MTAAGTIQRRTRHDAASVRIMEKLVPQPNGCMHWAGYIDHQGYGRVGYKGRRSTPLQQAVYDCFIGPLPQGMVPDHVCHTRDTTCPGGRSCLHRRCGNPEHLEAVLSKENVRRGRSGSGTNSRKTHCHQGHEFSAANTYLRPGKKIARICRTCDATRRAAKLVEKASG